VATKVEFSGLRRLIRQEEADKPQAGAILVKGNGRRRRILLVTNKEKKRWIFPKGSVKKKETSEQAAEREAEEESGVRGHVVAYVGATEYEEDGDLIRVDYFLLAATSESKMLEDRDRRWCKPDELLDLIDTPEVLALLRIALPEIKLFPIES
jgi:8-oxo-dGTP pyrophosphatase MutT (NUDIX family)